MGERLSNEAMGFSVDEKVLPDLGRVTILEALAVETSAISPDGLGRSTMQGQVDFDD